MDIVFLHQGQRFLWDMGKASANLAKHGVSFEEACQVFFDPLLRVRDATAGNEAREAVIGLTESWLLLFVVHVVREQDGIRIISARPVTAQERRFYEDDE
ncbi:MAG TPA: BrnT family toxin [Granulicella sp.]